MPTNSKGICLVFEAAKKICAFHLLRTRFEAKRCRRRRRRSRTRTLKPITAISLAKERSSRYSKRYETRYLYRFDSRETATKARLRTR